ncbi:hypothetical protein AMAG_20173, partial [Allomyces macrogynus ATCC 38327]
MMLSPSSPPRSHPPSTPAPGAPASTGTTPANSPRLAFLASCLARARGAHDDDDEDEDSFISTDLTSDLSSAATDEDDFDARSRSPRTDEDEGKEDAPYWSHSGIDAYVRSTGAAMALNEDEDGMLTAAVEAGDGEAWHEYGNGIVADGNGQYGLDGKDRVEGNETADDTIAGTGATIDKNTMRDDGAVHDAFAATTSEFKGELVNEDPTADDFVCDSTVNPKGNELMGDGLVGEDATTDETMSDDALDPEAMADDDDARLLAEFRSIDDDIDRALSGWTPYSAGTAVLDEFHAHPPASGPDGVAPDPDAHKNDLPTFLLSLHLSTHLDDSDDDSDASDDGTTAHDRALPLPLHPMGSRGPGRRHASWPLPAPPPAVSETVSAARP